VFAYESGLVADPDSGREPMSPPSGPAGDAPDLRPATADELPALAEMEARGDAMFAVAGWPLPPDDESLVRLRRAVRVLVIGRPPGGFAALEVVDGAAHLEQLVVEPALGRRGLGRALLEAAATHARERMGSETLTLTTFRDVPWNGPWYARCGFVELDEASCGPELRAIRAEERAAGLDDVAPRVAMVRRL
jgi:GNAT superfamily N-acetyltransferase